MVKILKLDYTIESPEERKELVAKILEETPNPSPAYLEILSNYIVFCMEKQEKKAKKILTDNRMTTVNKRECSFEGLVSQLENGEDGIYNLLDEDNKQIIFQPKVVITRKDLEEMPELKQVREAIQFWENKAKTAQGKELYNIKRTIIELRKDQYVIKDSYKRPLRFTHISHSKFPTSFDDNYELDENGYVIPNGISLADPKICSAILCNYSKLKQDSWDHFDSDLYYLIESFDAVSAEALRPYPIYEEIVLLKIDGKQNIQIQDALLEKFGIKHSLEYISSLWRNKIPNLIASAAEDEILYNHFLNKEKGKYKKCSRCGQIKLAHNKYFSKNKTSKDSFYSICKECRKTKPKEGVVNNGD